MTHKTEPDVRRLLCEAHDALNAVKYAQGYEWDSELAARVSAVQARLREALGFNTTAAAAPLPQDERAKASKQCDEALLAVHDHLAKALRIPTTPWPDASAHGHEALGRAIHASYCAMRFKVMDAIAELTAARAALSAASPGKAQP